MKSEIRKILNVSISFMMVASVFVGLFVMDAPENVSAETADPPFEDLTLIPDDEIAALGQCTENGDFDDVKIVNQYLNTVMPWTEPPENDHDYEKIAAGDIDNDGVDELIILYGEGEDIHVWDVGYDKWNVGVDFPDQWGDIGAYTVRDIACGDFNGDNEDDIVALGQSTENGHFDDIKIVDGHLNTLMPWTEPPENDHSYYAITAGDIDYDGVDELIILYGYGEDIHVWDVGYDKWNVGADFPDQWGDIGGYGVLDVACGNFNNDGKDEIVALGQCTENGDWDDIKIVDGYLNSLMPWTEPPEHDYNFNAIAAGDVDNDGFDELIILYGWGEDVQVWDVGYDKWSVGEDHPDQWKDIGSYNIRDIACGDFDGDSDRVELDSSGTVTHIGYPAAVVFAAPEEVTINDAYMGISFKKATGQTSSFTSKTGWGISNELEVEGGKMKAAWKVAYESKCESTKTYERFISNEEFFTNIIDDRIIYSEITYDWFKYKIMEAGIHKTINGIPQYTYVFLPKTPGVNLVAQSFEDYMSVFKTQYPDKYDGMYQHLENYKMHIMGNALSYLGDLIPANVIFADSDYADPGHTGGFVWSILEREIEEESKTNKWSTKFSVSGGGDLFGVLKVNDKVTFSYETSFTKKVEESETEEIKITGTWPNLPPGADNYKYKHYSYGFWGDTDVGMDGTIMISHSTSNFGSGFGFAESNRESGLSFISGVMEVEEMLTPLTLEITTDQNVDDVIISTVQYTKDPTHGFKVGKIDSYFLIEATKNLDDAISSPDGVTIKIDYNDANQDGVVDGTNVDENTLKINWWNTETSLWEELSSEVDVNNNVVSATTDHFCFVAAFGNLIPTSDAGPPQAVDEGTIVSFDGSGSSDEDGTIVSWEWNFGDGSTGSGQNPFHRYMDDETYTVTLTVTDNDGSTDTDTCTIIVNDLAPQAGFDWIPQPQDEGFVVSFTDTSISYPDSITSWSWDFAGLGSSTDDDTTFVFMDDGTYPVTLTVTDDDGSTDSTSHTVTIDDVVPDAQFSWPSNPSEGSSVQFTDDSISYPDIIVTWSWNFAGLGTSALQDPQFTFMDDGSYLVSLLVIDDDGSQDSISQWVTILDSTPTADFSWTPDPQDEGSTVVFTDLSTSSPDTIVSWYWDFGCGHVSTQQSPSHTYGDNGYLVTLTVTDDDGSTDTISITIPVLNVAPTVEAGEDQETDEGTEISFDGSFTDPGWLDTHTIEWDFDDGNIITGDLTPLHTYIDNGVYTVTLTITDDDGGVGIDTLTVIVNNVAPIMDDIAGIETYEGTYYELNINFFDPGTSDTHEGTIDWGDGTVDPAGISFSDGSGILSGTHPYADNDIYYVTITLTDDDGGFTSQTFPITVHNVAPCPGLVEAYMYVDFTLTVNGEEWDKVEMYLLEDGIPIHYVELNHPPGPGYQTITMLDVKCDMTKHYTANVIYTPPTPPGGGGAASAVYLSIILTFDDLSQVFYDHMVISNQQTTYGWDVDFEDAFVGHEITFEGPASDPGADDLTFLWNFGDIDGDGVPDFVGPNFYPNDGTFPMTATDTVYYTYNTPGIYTVILTVTDDDGGEMNVIIIIHMGVISWA